MSLSLEAAIENYLRTSKAWIFNIGTTTALRNNFWLQMCTVPQVLAPEQELVIVKSQITSKILIHSEEILINSSKTNSKCQHNIFKRMKKCLTATEWEELLINSKTFVDIITIW